MNVTHPISTISVSSGNAHSELQVKSSHLAPSNGQVPHSGEAKIDNGKLSKAIENLNAKMELSDTKVVFAHDSMSNRVWVNVVNNHTGKVVVELPPEAVRQIVDGHFPTTGLAVDKRL